MTFYQFITDPLTYINWGSAIAGIWVAWHGKKQIDKSKSPIVALVWLLLIGFTLVGCLFICKVAGDAQIERLLSK